MNIQDIQTIVMAARTGSFSKAAERLLVAQPALSKRVKKVEQEYGITLFSRTMGSSLKLTDEGKIFLEMADGILKLHSDFEKQLYSLQSIKKNTIIFGITSQQAGKVVTPLLKTLHKEHDQYFVDIRMGNSKPLENDVLSGAIDMALVNVLERCPGIYYETIESLELGIYLRAGSPVSQKAVLLPSFSDPVLRLEDLADEILVSNSPGSNSRAYLEKLMEKTGISLKITELTNFHNRIAMVETGKASFIIPVNWSRPLDTISRDLFYRLDPSQNLQMEQCLICRSGFQKNPKFRIVLNNLKQIYA
ncbi:MAG: LysR family transcriptional regulator [Clostridiaceae bacterium]|nr:LysR family transcriptional regulator [Clostridiaceae bacterium]